MNVRKWNNILVYKVHHFCDSNNISIFLSGNQQLMSCLLISLTANTVDFALFQFINYKILFRAVA